MQNQKHMLKLQRDSKIVQHIIVNFISVFCVPSFSFIYEPLIQQARYTMPFSQGSKIIKIFYAYASNATSDKKAFEKLLKHLNILRWNISEELIEIQTWYDSDVGAGTNRQKSIDIYISKADIIVLLVSTDFLASTYFYEVGVKRLLERYEAGTVRILSVLLQSIDLIGIPLLEKSDILPTNGKPINLWSPKDAAFSAVVRGIRRVIEELLTVPSTNARRPVDGPKFPLQMFSYRENPFFTGREEILDTLHRHFVSPQSSQTRIQVLKGIDGIGKTQIAIEYVIRYKEDYQAIFWIRADARNRFRADVTTLADQLFLPESEYRNEQLLFTAVQRWLQNNHSWLIILDNIEDFTLIDHIIPLHCDGHVILTTHFFATGPFTHTIAVEPMTADEGALFLLRRAKFITEDKPQDKVLAADYAQAIAIAREFDGYTLALDQAGAYIDETQSDLTTYLALYHECRTELLQHSSHFPNVHAKSVTATLSLAFKKVARTYAPAIDLLLLLSFLHIDAIPYEILKYGKFGQNISLQKLVTNPIALSKAIATLLSYSLISRRADRNILNIHRIVQAVIKDPLTQEQQRQWAICVIQLVNAVFPSSDFPNWSVCERYLPHAQVCAEYITRWAIVSSEAAQLLYNLGGYCYERALYNDAEEYLTQALSIREQEVGPEHIDAAESLNALARLYRQQGNYQRAEPLQKQSLAIHEKILGADHPETATILNNLALLYQEQGKLSLAEPLYLRILAIYEQAYGSEHPEIATTLNNLALLYRKQSKHSDAEPLYQRALKIRENTLEPGHPDIAQALSNIAAVYQYQQQHAKAEPLLLRALEIREQALGTNHPATAISINNLAFLYRIQEKYQQAEHFYQRAITIFEKVSGPEHPKLAPILKNLATLYKLQEKYQQAEPLYLRALTIYEQAFGPQYPDIISVLSNLAELYVDQKQYEQAEPLYQRALTINKGILDSEFSNTTLILEKYAILFEQMQRSEEAKELRQTIQDINDKNAHESSDTSI